MEVLGDGIDKERIGEHLDLLTEKGLLKRFIRNDSVCYRLTPKGLEIAGIWDDVAHQGL